MKFPIAARFLQSLIVLMMTVSVFSFSSADAQDRKLQAGLMPPVLVQFARTSEQAILQQHSYFNFTDQSSVSPDIKHFGIRTVFAPPYFINPFNVAFSVFGKQVGVESYIWYPSESVFIGKTMDGISTSARAVPLADERGGIYEVTLKNTTPSSLQLPITWHLRGKPGRVKGWGFSGDRTMKAADGQPSLYAVESGVRLSMDTISAGIVAFGSNYTYNDSSLITTVLLKAGDSLKTGLVFVVGGAGAQTDKLATAIAQNVQASITKTRTVWEDQLQTLLNTAPKLLGVSGELQKFYNTGLLSLESARWEVPEFIFSPWYGSCGIDGGAMISYLWEMSYSGKYASIVSPAITRQHLISYAKADMGRCYAVDPETGKGVGPLYSFNYYNLARLVYDYVSITGDFALLDEKVGTGNYLEYLYNFCLSKENLKAPADLIDYGNTHNLLELYKTDAYEHYVPNPNAERTLTYEMLTELYAYKTRVTPDDLIKRKKELTTAFRKQLWNEDLGWLNSLDANKKRKLCYSVMCFSTLRTNILTKKMQKALVQHLNEDEFLSQWGIYSLSLKDAGFDPGDADWGGPGIYTGAGPELVSDLFSKGFYDKGVEILKRILWWGELPYMPQAMRTNIKGYRENGRANLISGVCNAQNTAFGFFGLQISPSQIRIHPIKHDIVNGTSLKGLKVRNKLIDIEVSSDGKNYTVNVDGSAKTQSMNKEFVLKF